MDNTKKRIEHIIELLEKEILSCENRIGEIFIRPGKVKHIEDESVNSQYNGTAPETEMSLFFLSMFPLTRWPLGVP